MKDLNFEFEIYQMTNSIVYMNFFIKNNFKNYLSMDLDYIKYLRDDKMQKERAYY